MVLSFATPATVAFSCQTYSSVNEYYIDIPSVYKGKVKRNHQPEEADAEK